MGFAKRWWALMQDYQPLCIIFKDKGAQLAYNKMDEVKLVVARLLASWGVVIAWVSWGNDGVQEACHRSIRAQENLYSCHGIQY
jgi:hypothetical protein